MSKSDNKELHIKRKNLSEKKGEVFSGSSLKASKAASIKHVMKQSGSAQTSKAPSSSKADAAPKETKAAAAKAAASKVTFVDTEEIKDEARPAEPSKGKEIDLIWSTPTDTDKKGPKNIRWGLIIPALVVILCIALFAVASQAGWIQSFLTPPEKLIKNTTMPETTTTVPETTTEKPTTTKETTTEETTTEFVPSYYVINVNLAYNVVTVYERGEKLSDGWDPKDPLDDEYDLHPVIAFTCSPGIDGATPTGTYYLQGRAAWCFMVGDVYTQYATRIVDDVMFHSVPYYKEDPSTLETDQYNILGYEASSACIRLNVRDAAWIFNYCAEETEVNIFYNWDYYGPLDPEPIYRIPEDIPQLAGWDPTDVYSSGNPWFSYSAGLTSDNVTLPCYSSVDSLIAAIGPTDHYGNNLASHFSTDGNYNLDYPGVYTTTGYINVGNLSFSFPITITVTEEVAEEYYYNEDGYEEYDETGYDETGYDEYSETEAYWDWSEETGYAEEPVYEETYYEETYYEETAAYAEDQYYEDYSEYE